MSRLTSPRTALTTSPRRTRTRDQRGLVMSSPLALVSAGAILLVGAAYVVTDPPAPTEIRLTTAAQESEPPTVFAPALVEPVVDRGDTFVVVFNNSGISGLAARTSDRLTGAGWNVVGSDNWYGTIPTTTVYYPERFEEAARVLAEDLAIDRVIPAVDPMQMDRLTVILTADVG